MSELKLDYEGLLAGLDAAPLNPYEVKLLRKEIRLERAILWLKLANIPIISFHLIEKGMKLREKIDARLKVLMQIEQKLRK